MATLRSILTYPSARAPGLVEKTAADLARAFGAPPEIRAARHAPAEPEESYDVVCRISAEPQTVRFSDFAYDRLAITFGPDEPGEAEELAAAEAFAWQAADRARLLLERWIESRIGAGSRPVLVCTKNWQRPVADAALELRGLEQRFRFHGPLLVTCAPEARDAWAALAGPEWVRASDQALGDRSYAALVVLTDGPGNAPAEALQPLLDRCPCYLFRTPQLLRLERLGKGFRGRADRAANRHLGHNHFVAAGGAKGPLGEFETPIGKALAVTNGLGPRDPFGHRIGGRTAALAERAGDHLVVAFFGGSGVFSPRCFHDDTLPGAVSRALNVGPAEDSGVTREFAREFTQTTVLNFGEQAGTVTDALGNLAHFGSLARPDVVVAHLGANEFGAFENDPALVDDFGMFYPTQYGSGEIGKPVARNDAAALAAALTERIDALRLFARGIGAAFVLGFQPSLSFKAPTPQEEDAVERVFQRRPRFAPHVHLAWNLYGRGLPKLRAWAEACAAVQADFRLLDLTSAFAADGGESVFYDHVHLTPAGNRALGLRYAAVIAALAAGRQHRRPVVDRLPRDAARPGRDAALEASLDATIAEAAADPALADLAALLRAQRRAILEAGYGAEEPDRQDLGRLNYPLD